MKTPLLNLSLFLALPLASFGQAVATVAGQSISVRELLDALGPQQLMQMRNQEYEQKNKALESLIRLKLEYAERPGRVSQLQRAFHRIAAVDLLRSS